MRKGNEKRIMVVDDDDMNLQMAEFILKKEMSAEVLLADSGYKCIEMLQKDAELDLILLDIQMPRMDGIRTLEMIRNHSEWKGIPVIFLTAAADKETVIKAGQLKVNDYVKKPFMPKDLVERVNKVLAMKALDDLDKDVDLAKLLDSMK